MCDLPSFPVKAKTHLSVSELLDLNFGIRFLYQLELLTHLCLWGVVIAQLKTCMFRIAYSSI